MAEDGVWKDCRVAPFQSQCSDPSIENLLLLFQNHNWQSVVNISAQLLTGGHAAVQEESYCLFCTLRFESLFRLKLYDDLNVEVNNALDQFENYAKTLSTLGFVASLKLLQCEVKLITGHSVEALEQLLSIKTWLNDFRNSTNIDVTYWVWQCDCHVANIHVRSRNWKSAVRLFRELLASIHQCRDVISDPLLLSMGKCLLLLRISKCLLQIGSMVSAKNHFEAARDTLLTFRSGVDQSPEFAFVQTLCSLTHGLILFAEEKYDEALSCFQTAMSCGKVTEIEFVAFGANISIFHVLYRSKDESLLSMAVNNYCVCCLHLKRNLHSIDTMEKLIAENPVKFLSDSMVFNLCTMYDLSFSSDASTAKKKSLQRLAVRYGHLDCHATIRSRTHSIMDFLSAENQCGQNLLRIVSRGAAIIAELLRLSSNIPDVFRSGEKGTDNDCEKYKDVLFDFQYLKQPEEFEKRVNDSTDLLDLDQEFQENHQDILRRFYMLFESIWKYQFDLNKFFDDVSSGYYIRYSMETILEEVEGIQLCGEAFYLYGVMLLLLEDKIPGLIREKMLIAVYRQCGEGGMEHCDEVFKLCRNTGYLSSSDQKRPKNYPETFFARFAPNAEMLRLVIGRLQTDDIYLMTNAFPNPDHRSVRLANQAAMLFVILYFSPDVLRNKATMREIVDKHFNDNWMISTYMGSTVDLFEEWGPYPAAKSALDNVLNNSTIRQLNDTNSRMITKCLDDLKGILKEGVLQQEYLLDNLNNLLNSVRNCNIALRWRLLHRKCRNDGIRAVIEAAVNPQVIVALLLNTSHLEYVLKEMLKQLLDEKDLAWTEGKSAAASRMLELSEHFSGEKSLSRAKRDESLMNWFGNLASQVDALNLDEQHSTVTGRKIQSIVAALEDVEQFEAVDTNVQIKSFLNEVRDNFRTMIRTVNVKNEILNVLETISDFSYAWQTLSDYVPVFHERIGKDPSSVVLLRATFLKTASVLEIPLVRITAINSPDAVSVAEYYSGELVEFVRIVLEIIPVSVFRVLGRIVDIQTTRMTAMPIRLEAKDLKDYAQLEVRSELARLTHQVSVFTEGILVMEKTLLGVVQVEPRQILEEGLRRELVRLLSKALDDNLAFRELSRHEINENMSRVAKILDGLKKSIEYLQDYIAIAGLKIYQQDFSRVINYFTEQEANRYVKKKTYDNSSRYQNRAVPIPRLINNASSQEDTATTFMGRVAISLIALTDPSKTVFAPGCTAWFAHGAPDQKNPSTVEVCGIRTFALLERSIGVIGLRGLDRLLAFRTVHILNGFLRFYESSVSPFRELLGQVRNILFPEYKIPTGGSKVYLNAAKKLEPLMLPLLKVVRLIGQSQLIRRQISNVLQFGCQMDAHLLFQALDTFNRSLFGELRSDYETNSTMMNRNIRDNSVLFETSSLLEACGLDDPMQKIYLTTQPLEGFPVLLFLFLLSVLPNLDYDPWFGSLIRRKSKYPVDGVPLVVGMSCLLKQFHPSYADHLLSYMGQFIRCSLHETFFEADSKIVDVPKEILNSMIFLEQLCVYSSMPRDIIHRYIPSYIFDAMKIPSPAKK